MYSIAALGLAFALAVYFTRNPAKPKPTLDPRKRHGTQASKAQAPTWQKKPMATSPRMARPH